MFTSILKTKLRAFTREMSEEWPTYFILGPVMFTVVFLLGRKVFNDFAFDVGRLKQVSLEEETVVRLGFFFLFLKVYFNFLPLAKRLYPTENRLTIEDLLPIDFNTRYKVFYIEQLIRDLPFFLFAAVLMRFLGNMNLIAWPFVIWLFFPGVEIGFTLTWIHVKSPDRKELGGAFLVMLFMLWLIPVKQFSWWADAVTFIFVPLGYYKGFKTWRYRDIGRVEKFLSDHSHEKRNTTTAILEGFSRLMPKQVRPLLRRDLILTARNFVPHFWRNLGLSLLITSGVATRGSLVPELFCAVAVFVLASTVSPLFALQRPFRPMDVVLPLHVAEIWKSKLYYARMLSLPIPFIIWGIELFMRPLPLEAALLLLMKLVLVSFAISSIVGGSICEGDQRPVLQYIVAGMMSALAAVFIIIFHPGLVLMLFPVLSHLKGSAITRLAGEGVVS